MVKKVANQKENISGPFQANLVQVNIENVDWYFGEVFQGLQDHIVVYALYLSYGLFLMSTSFVVV